MISELGGRLPSTHSSRQPLRCAARVFVVAHHLLKRYLGALQPVVCQNHARQLRLLWSSIYRTLASLNLSCQRRLFEVLNRLGRWSAYGQTLLSGENSGSDQLIVVELIKRRTGQDSIVSTIAFGNQSFSPRPGRGDPGPPQRNAQNANEHSCALVAQHARRGSAGLL